MASNKLTKWIKSKLVFILIRGSKFYLWESSSFFSLYFDPQLIPSSSLNRFGLSGSKLRFSKSLSLEKYKTLPKNYMRQVIKYIYPF
jgi:hypothetical protein